MTVNGTSALTERSTRIDWVDYAKGICIVMRWLYEREVMEPRLTAPWSAESGVPLEPSIVEEKIGRAHV